MPKSAGDLGESAGAGEGRGGIWIFNCDPNRTILLWVLAGFSSDCSSLRASRMPRPSFLESNLSQWLLLSGFGDFLVSDHIGFLEPKKVLPSRIEVGLGEDSVSVNPFDAKPVKSFGEVKIDEMGFINLSLGDGKETQSAIRACFLVALDLFAQPDTARDFSRNRHGHLAELHRAKR